MKKRNINSISIILAGISIYSALLFWVIRLLIPEWVGSAPILQIFLLLLLVSFIANLVSLFFVLSGVLNSITIKEYEKLKLEIAIKNYKRGVQIFKYIVIFSIILIPYSIILIIPLPASFRSFVLLILIIVSLSLASYEIKTKK